MPSARSIEKNNICVDRIVMLTPISRQQPGHVSPLSSASPQLLFMDKFVKISSSVTRYLAPLCAGMCPGCKHRQLSYITLSTVKQKHCGLSLLYLLSVVLSLLLISTHCQIIMFPHCMHPRQCETLNVEVNDAQMR